MFTLEGFSIRKSDPISVFYDDAELSLHVFSNRQDYIYPSLFSSQFSMSVAEYPNVIPSLALRNPRFKDSKQQALKDLVESAAAPYLQ